MQPSGPGLYKHLPPDEQAVLKAALDGTFFTEDYLSHIGAADLPKCPFCSARDSIHRIWECQALAPASAMQGFPVEPALLPQCQSWHGWAMFVAEVDSLHVAMAAPAFFSFSWSLPAVPRVVLDLYTDGSCLLPAIKPLGCLGMTAAFQEDESGSLGCRSAVGADSDAFPCGGRLQSPSVE